MTTKPRRSGGAAKPAEAQAKAEIKDEEKAGQAAAKDVEATDNVKREGEQPGTAEPERHATDGGNAAGEGASVGQLAAAEDVLHLDGDPVPAEVDRGMALPETGISPEPFTGGEVATAPTGDDERNGKPTAIGTDTSGEMRNADPAVPTAATGADDARNGAPLGMAGTTDRGGELRGRDAAARLEGSGVRAERGVGTLDRDLEPDERPTYPSTTLTRATPDAAPMEPDDVKRATQPKLGDPQTSTDPIAAAAAIRSQAGDDTVDLVDDATGKSIKPSQFFEVPDGPIARTYRRVNARVVEVYTVRHVKTPNRRLLFTDGQMVPVAMAETLISLHG